METFGGGVFIRYQLIQGTLSVPYTTCLDIASLSDLICMISLNYKGNEPFPINNVTSRRLDAEATNLKTFQLDTFILLSQGVTESCKSLAILAGSWEMKDNPISISLATGVLQPLVNGPK